MKKIFFVVAFIFSISAFSKESNNQINLDPLIINTSCGTSYEMDDEGMSDEDIFALTEFLDDFDCNNLFGEYLIIV